VQLLIPCILILLVTIPFFWVDNSAILAAQCLHSYWLTSDLGLIIIYC
jgi:hypothetical protein